MSEPDNQAEAMADEEGQVPPLTRNGYRRLPTTERQIHRVLGLDGPALLARARITDSGSPDHLGPEALVFLIRRANQQRKDTLVSSLFGELIKRCAPVFRSKFRGFSEDRRADLQQQVLAQIAREILAQDDRGDFAQRRFWTYLDRRATNAGVADRRKDPPMERLDAPLNPDDPQGDAQVDLLEDLALSPEGLLQLREGLAQLPPTLREVYILRHVYGHDIGKERREDEDPAKPSLAVHFDVSSKTIQNWLKRAEAALEPYRKA